MVRKYQRKPDKNLKMARARIDKLFLLSDNAFFSSAELSDRYVDLARKLAMKYKVKLSSAHKRKFCKHCYKYLRPGTNCRVRTVSGKLVYTCLACRKFSRFTIKN